MNRSIVIALLTLTFLSYQNCSKVAYDSVDQSKSMAKAEGEAEVDVTQPGSTEETQPHESVEQLRDYCEQAKKKALMVNPTQIQALNGSFTASISFLDKVVDVQGKLVLVGQNSQSKINIIQNTKGRLIVCNLNVDFVLDTRGRVEFVDSHIGKVQTHNGNIRILGSSTVADFQDIIGTVKDE